MDEKLKEAIESAVSLSDEVCAIDPSELSDWKQRERLSDACSKAIAVVHKLQWILEEHLDN